MNKTGFLNKRKAPDVLIRTPPDTNPNQDLVDFLRELANYEKDVSKNLFKSHAYRKAAGELARFPERITSGAEAKKLGVCQFHIEIHIF